jgi:hypothetical protein
MTLNVWEAAFSDLYVWTSHRGGSHSVARLGASAWGDADHRLEGQT